MENIEYDYLRRQFATYREDLDTVRTAIARMKREGLSPDQLWT